MPVSRIIAPIRTGLWRFFQISLPVHLALVVGIAFLHAGIGALMLETRVASGDSVEYLTGAHTLFNHGIYATGLDRAAPGALAPREPLYPAVLAGIMALDSSFESAGRACFETLGNGCEPALSIVSAANAVFYATTGVVLFLTVLAFRAPLWAAWIAAIYVFANTEAMDELAWVMSDYLALLVVALFVISIALAARTGRAWTFIVPGLIAGLMALTKVAFFIYGLAGLALLFTAAIGVLVFRRRSMMLVATLALAAGFVPLAGGWVLRNAIVLETPAFSEGRSSETIGLRIAFNNLSAGQMIAGFVYWTRGFGDGLARDVFDADTVAPFHWYGPGDFYQTTQSALIAEVNSETAAFDGDLRAANAKVSGRLIREVAADPISHLQSTPLFVYRGLWIDDFVLIGFPLLVLALWRSDWVLLIAFSPGVFGILFYALVSLNPPRYQLTSVPTLALGASLALAMLTGWRHQSRDYLLRSDRNRL